MNAFKGTTGSRFLSAALIVLVLSSALVAVGGAGSADAAATASIDGVSYCDADDRKMSVTSHGYEAFDWAAVQNPHGQLLSERVPISVDGAFEIPLEAGRISPGNYSIQAFRYDSDEKRMILLGGVHDFVLYEVVLDRSPVGVYGTDSFRITLEEPVQTSSISKMEGATWALDEEGTMPVTEISAGMFGNGLTLTIYQVSGVVPVTCTVTFDSNGGSAVESQTVAKGGIAVRPADPVLEGMSFTGWHTDEACTQVYDFSTPVTRDITLYAGWSEIPYRTVTFASNGGSAVEPQRVADGSTVAKPADPVRAGSVFTGWYTDITCSSLYDFFSPVTGDITLYAGWAVEKYTVTFDSRGGSAVQSVMVEAGSAVAKPADPVRDGYTFNGWYTDEACTQAYDFSSPVIRNMTLFAGWTESPAPSGGDDNSLIWAGAVIAVVVILLALVAALVLAKKKKSA